MNILLLGGYLFLGPALIEAAQARGHSVSAFNRGRRTPLPGVEQITGDRADPSALRGRRWDVVIDTSGYAPRQTRSAADVLRDRVDRYIFISSISVYGFPMPAGADETTPVMAVPEGCDLDDVHDNETYGIRKAACEASLAEAMPGRVLCVRAGFIVGPHDNSDRFNSWIERAARPEPMIVPGDPAAPMQLIDVRDLAEWTIAQAERGTTGTFNVTGPARPLALVDVARACCEGTGSTQTPVVIPSETLAAEGVVPWQHIPFWLAPEEFGIMEANIDRALATGLQFRELTATVRDTYAWLRTSEHPRRIVFPPELERAAVGRFLTR